jgi:hypothetical protein
VGLGGGGKNEGGGGRGELGLGGDRKSGFIEDDRNDRSLEGLDSCEIKSFRKGELKTGSLSDDGRRLGVDSGGKLSLPSDGKGLKGKL